jgi:hypothetical protein
MTPPEYTGLLKFFYDWQTIIAGLLAFLVGAAAAIVVVWQGGLIKRQIAFSTYLDLDKEWNSEEMIDYRQQVHLTSDKWDTSRLEGILEFFEKLAVMFKVSGDMSFIYGSTLGWYAARFNSFDYCICFLKNSLHDDRKALLQ